MRNCNNTQILRMAGLTWLRPFIDTSYFKECSCTQHANSRDKKFFCVDCIRGPFCLHKISTEHASHITLQVRKCTRRESVKIDDVKRLLNIDGIQVYSFNNAPVVYLRQRSDNSTDDNYNAKKDLACMNCCKNLIDGKSLYCSIACKFSIETASIELLGASTSAPYHRQQNHEKGKEKMDEESTSIMHDPQPQILDDMHGMHIPMHNNSPLLSPPLASNTTIMPPPRRPLHRRKRFIPCRSPNGMY